MIVSIGFKNKNQLLKLEQILEILSSDGYVWMGGEEITPKVASLALIKTFNDHLEKQKSEDTLFLRLKLNVYSRKVVSEEFILEKNVTGITLSPSQFISGIIVIDGNYLAVQKCNPIITHTEAVVKTLEQSFSLEESEEEIVSLSQVKKKKKLTPDFTIGFSTGLDDMISFFEKQGGRSTELYTIGTITRFLIDIGLEGAVPYLLEGLLEDEVGND